jgi:hypothetical protein
LYFPPADVGIEITGARGRAQLALPTRERATLIDVTPDDEKKRDD